MVEHILEVRIKKAVDEAKELSEYWVGTPYDGIIRTEMGAVLDNMGATDSGKTEELLSTLETTLAKAREESERSTNEG